MNNYNPNFKNQTRILETYTIETSVKAKNVKVSKEAFNVLILGVDIREDEGDIHSNTRADTIMVASFDPKTMKASLVSIPRDTYTPLSYNNQEDKLTHAGFYGVGCMIETVENLLDININYYAKFNFKALVGLVDALGGIEVDVPFSFSESNSDDIPNTVHVTEGLQILDGEKALAYARHRSTQNDHVRNNSQQEVLKAILNKMVAFDTVTKINDLLDVLNTNMSTNLGRQEILDLITLVPRLGELQMSTMVIEGEDYETYVSKYDDYLWITQLSETSLQKAKEMIYGD
jgi:LCP family protein required for cell wall assembly